ncbi:helicase-exonuclease AddAB subunit AddA [Intestinibacter bartlettii]|uniref:helicase-exonuclease AddAB subunit AddA n=1 Tax=Intestinibacter bartlettii TaxID=261299 RepID=UPI00241EDE6E|nr:helicase-exonuclease AddAB subunit AddA [Intestinibacter bartlettii]MDU6472891.1 helicase-exonuclease AddAB subunit AddA [Intestinibacter bartlettii]
MSSPKWTQEQQNVIDSRGGNLLVAAAAGSGKTAVLVERIIQMILNSDLKIDIDKLLVVTFTNAAASEMRERIGDAISKKLDENPEDEHLQDQLVLLNKASITTIHSFCLEVIKSNFHKINLDPNFRIGDETECSLMKLEAIDETFDILYEQNDEEFCYLVDCYAEKRGDSNLQNLILSIYSFVMASPYPKVWLKESAEDFNITDDFDFARSKWAKAILETVKIQMEGIEKSLCKAIEDVDGIDELVTFTDKLKMEYEKIKEILYACDTSWSDAYRQISSMTFENYAKGVKRIPKDAPSYIKEEKDKAKKIRDNAKKSIEKIKTSVFNKNYDDLKDEIKFLYPIVKSLSDVVLMFEQIYSQKKRDKGIIDFNDIEHFALQILTETDENGDFVFDEEGKNIPSDIALEYREKFYEIFIDEYQDSNQVQEVILSTIAKQKEPNRFMVGDVKQSIYRFRQAKPEIFLQKYATYDTDLSSKYKKIMLYKNFRSRKEVVDSVNYIFEHIMSKNLGEIDYNEEEKLNLGANFEEVEDEKIILGGATEIHLMEKKVPEVEDPDEEEEEGEDLDASQIEARMVGKIIRDIMRPNENGEIMQVFDKKLETYRNVEYKDIVILLRATSAWAPVFAEELINMDIPTYADMGQGYFETMEIQVIMSFLKVIDNPMQDIPLIAILRSPIYGFTPEDFIDIRITDKKVSFYEAMRMFVGEKIDLSNAEEQDIAEDEISDDTGNEIIDVNINKENSYVDADMDDYYQNINYEDFEYENEEFIYNDEVIYESYINENVEDDLIYEINSNIEGDEESQKSELELKVRRFLDDLKELQEKSMYMSTDEFLWYIYTNSGYYAYCGALPGGSQRQANLRILFERAKQFEETSFKGIFNFINFISKLKKSNSDMGSAKTLGENANVVRIMSIHKSKGLEFPIVICSGMGRNFNTMDFRKDVLYHHELGYGPQIVDFERRISYPSIAKEALKCKINIENISEEMRILYVALTRAKEKLIITSSIKDIEQNMHKWSSNISTEKMVSKYDILNGKNYMDWMMPAIIKHKDLEDIRETYNLSTSISMEDESKWSVKTWSRDDIDFEKHEKEGIREVLNTMDLSQHDTEYYEQIEKKLNFEYPYLGVVKKAASISVTEIKKRQEEYEEQEDSLGLYKHKTTLKKPKFLSESQKSEKITGARRGTIVHLIMEVLDFEKVNTESEIKAQIQDLVKRRIITEKESQVLSPRKIMRFFKSPIAKRMLSSKFVKREQKIYTQIKMNDIYLNDEIFKNNRETYENESVMLRGVIDLYFEEDDGLVILDYKTDFVDENNKKEIIHKYKKQIEIYADVLSKLTGKKVKEKYLYLFGIDEQVKVD